MKRFSSMKCLYEYQQYQRFVTKTTTPQVNGLQKPFIKRVEDIGFWQDAFEVLSVISIVVNCSLIGIRGQVFDSILEFNPLF